MTRVHAFDFSSRLQDTLSFIVELILHGTFFPNIPLLFPTMSLFFSKIPVLFLKIPIFYHPFTAKLTIFSPSSLNPAPALQDIKSLRWSGSTITILTPLLSYSKSWVTYHTTLLSISEELLSCRSTYSRKLQANLWAGKRNLQKVGEVKLRCPYRDDREYFMKKAVNRFLPIRLTTPKKVTISPRQGTWRQVQGPQLANRIQMSALPLTVWPRQFISLSLCL